MDSNKFVSKLTVCFEKSLTNFCVDVARSLVWRKLCFESTRRRCPRLCWKRTHYTVRTLLSAVEFSHEGQRNCYCLRATIVLFWKRQEGQYCIDAPVHSAWSCASWCTWAMSTRCSRFFDEPHTPGRGILASSRERYRSSLCVCRILHFFRGDLLQECTVSSHEVLSNT